MNFLDHFWPNLLKHDGFLCEFVTPVIKARKGTSTSSAEKTKAFYTIPEYEGWFNGMEPEQQRKWRVKYYKGLFSRHFNAILTLFKAALTPL
jgi:DNA topoisomerase II